MSDGSLDYETDILPWLYMLHVVNYFYFSVLMFITQNVLPHCFQKQLPICIILLKLNCHGLLHVILLQGMALKYSMVVSYFFMPIEKCYIPKNTFFVIDFQVVLLSSL